MKSNKKIAVLGGDTRQIALSARLASCGLRIHSFGLPLGEDACRIQSHLRFEDAVKGAQTVLLPLPASPDGKRLNMPLAGELEAPRLTDIFLAAEPDAVIAGGRFTPAIKRFAEEREIRLFDYFESEELQQKNALPTAEGAISILMRELPCTVSGLSVGVTGFGRVAKTLSALLIAMGAKVTVLARRQSALDEAAAMGCATVLLRGEHSTVAFSRDNAVIFNTVPYWLFSDAVLSEMSPRVLIIDLASAPGGVDANAASARGIKVIWALSLPGRYAPQTAGEIIAETVLSYMKKEGLL